MGKTDFKFDLTGLDVQNFFNNPVIEEEDSHNNPSPKPEDVEKPDPKPKPDPTPEPDPKPDPSPDPDPEVDPEEEEEDSSIFDEVKGKLGYEVEGQFDNNVDGLTDFIKASAEKISEESFKELMTEYPDVAEYLKFRVNGGDANEYGKYAFSSDITNLTLSEDDEDTAKTVLSKFLEKSGFTTEEIREKIDDYEDANILHKEATRALKKLQAINAKEKEELITRQVEAQEKEKLLRKEQVAEITNLVTKGNLKNIQVPEKEKKQFLNWMFTPVNKEGKTQRSMDLSQLDGETSLAIEYLLFKKLDFGGLASKQKETEAAKTIRERLGLDNKKTLTGNKSKPNSLPKLNEIFG